jgi:hypothetical protein
MRKALHTGRIAAVSALTICPGMFYTRLHAILQAFHARVHAFYTNFARISQAICPLHALRWCVGGRRVEVCGCTRCARISELYSSHIRVLSKLHPSFVQVISGLCPSHPSRSKRASDGDDEARDEDGE